jgi:hypothetical protein
MCVHITRDYGFSLSLDIFVNLLYGIKSNQDRCIKAVLHRFKYFVVSLKSQEKFSKLKPKNSF